MANPKKMIHPFSPFLLGDSLCSPSIHPLQWILCYLCWWEKCVSRVICLQLLMFNHRSQPWHITKLPEVLLQCNYLLQIVSQWQMDPFHLFHVQMFSFAVRFWILMGEKKLKVRFCYFLAGKLQIFGFLFFVLSLSLSKISSMRSYTVNLEAQIEILGFLGFI